MPLEPGCDEETISRNIAEMVRNGHPQDVAAAAAYENCREGKALSKSLYAAPAPVGLFSRVKDGVAIYKGDDGRRYMFLVTSNSYKDREHETITSKALQEYVDNAWTVEDKCLPNNPLLLWHDDGPKHDNAPAIGDIVWTDMEGPFLLEVAKERPNRKITVKGRKSTWTTTIKAVWDALESDRKYRWGASHGFRYADSAKENGVYERIRKFETSVLPLDAAANPYTFAGVIDDMNKDKVLGDLLKTPDIADKFRKDVRTLKAALDKRGLEHKALELEATKGKLDEALTIIQAAFDKIGGTVPADFAAQTLQNLVAAMASGDTEPDPNDPNEPAEVAAGETEYMAAMQGKQLKLFERLIRSQESLMNEGIETKKAMTTVAEAVTPLVELPGTVKSLADRLDAIEKRMSGAPRRASADQTTVVNDKELTEKAKAQAERYEALFPGLNIQVRPANGKEGQ